jgi:hypothetical protein
MLPNREGRFRARILSRGIGDSKNGALQLAVGYAIDQELQGGEWTDVSGEGMEITGYHYLVKTDGNLNTTTIESLKAAFGWDGADPTVLDTMELAPDHLVQITLKEEEYQGQSRIRVGFVDAADAQPGVRTASDDERKAIRNKYGSKFRAHAGGTPAAAPKPTSAGPKKPAPAPAGPSAGPSAGPKKPAPAKPKAAAAAAATSTQDECWQLFFETTSPGHTEEQVQQQWWRLLAKLFPNKEPDALTPEDWGVVKGQADQIPF